MTRLFPVLLLLTAAGCHDQADGDAGTRDQITAVGSSTVYPFTTMVAEAFVAADSQARAPVIESTGTGAGMKLFCAGIGPAHPDIEDASRRMTRSEYRACAAHGAGALIEVQVGIDGIAFAESRQGPHLALTPADLYRALAATPGAVRTPRRHGPTSIQRCLRSRSRSMAPPRPAARAMRWRH